MENEIAIIEKQVLNGNVNPLEAFVQLKKLEELSKIVKSKIKELAIEEAAKYGVESKKGIEIYDAVVSVKKGAGRWEYSHINEVVELEEKLKALKEKHKAAYKSSLHNQTHVDTETGEIIEPAYFRLGDETIIIKFKK